MLVWKFHVNSKIWHLNIQMEICIHLASFWRSRKEKWQIFTFALGHIFIINSTTYNRKRMHCGKCIHFTKCVTHIYECLRWHLERKGAINLLDSWYITLPFWMKPLQCLLERPKWVQFNSKLSESQVHFIPISLVCVCVCVFVYVFVFVFVRMYLCVCVCCNSKGNSLHVVSFPPFIKNCL